MINFTVGPVQSSDEVREVASMQVPYFRTPEFSSIMLENEKLMKKFTNAEESAKVVFITGSGTASMEASVMNCLTAQDKVLIINGGSFGQRFVDICAIHDIPYTEIKLEIGKNITKEVLDAYDNKGYTAFLVNIHETSTGVLYNIDLISEFCKKNNLFLIVDAISAFLADNIDIKKSNIDVLITSTQKAIACHPGLSVIVLSKNAVNRVQNNKVKSLYFDLKLALKNAERGQTPFTPAVGILLQVNARLKSIERDGGAEKEVERTHLLAKYFRDGISNLPLKIVSESMSNAVTSLSPLNGSAYNIFNVLKDEYNIWVCPNGGDLKDKIFRVGHIGYLTKIDYDKLIYALNQLHIKGVF